MSIKLITQETKLTVYDEVNIKHATDKEVVPLVTIVRGDFKLNVLDIISNSLNLNESEKVLYNIINVWLANNSTANVSHIIKWTAKDTNRSPITYSRAMEVLITKGVIKYINDKNHIILYDDYNINNISDAAKYILIEVNKI